MANNYISMTVGEFIALDVDMDVYDNVCEEIGIAKCGAYSLTEEGMKKWSDVLEYNVQLYPNNDTAIVDVDGEEGIWQERLARAKDFFYSLAGYCAYDDFDAWFIIE